LHAREDKKKRDVAAEAVKIQTPKPAPAEPLEVNRQVIEECLNGKWDTSEEQVTRFAREVMKMNQEEVDYWIEQDLTRLEIQRAEDIIAARDAQAAKDSQAASEALNAADAQAAKDAQDAAAAVPAAA